MPCKLLPCGHCESALTDDDCGKPEHRFCALCHAGECNEGLAEALEIMVKEKKALELQVEQYRQERDAALLQIQKIRSLAAPQSSGLARDIIRLLDGPKAATTEGYCTCREAPACCQIHHPEAM